MTARIQHHRGVIHGVTDYAQQTVVNTIAIAAIVAEKIFRIVAHDIMRTVRTALCCSRIIV